MDGKTITKKIHATGLANYIGISVMEANKMLVNYPSRVMNLDYFNKYATVIKGGQLISQ